MGNAFSSYLDSRNISKEELIFSFIGAGGSLTISYFLVQTVIRAMDPTREEKKRAQERAGKLIKKMGIQLDEPLDDYELCIAANLVDPNSIRTRWDDIGGLSSVIEEIKEGVIVPFTHPNLYRSSSLLQAPKGMLLYGPPGCGKTMIAKATAKAAGARFIDLQASSMFDKWYGESQKRTEALFSLARKISPTIIFIDEIDAMLRSRGSSDHESTAMMKSQFMSLWDGLQTDPKCQVLVLGATNRPLDVDPAFRRRMPYSIQISKPNEEDRLRVLNVLLREELIKDRVTLMRGVARQTDGLSGSDLKELCRNAALHRVRGYLRENQGSLPNSDSEAVVDLRDLEAADFDYAIRKMRTNSLSNPMGNAEDILD